MAYVVRWGEQRTKTDVLIGINWVSINGIVFDYASHVSHGRIEGFIEWGEGNVFRRGRCLVIKSEDI